MFTINAAHIEDCTKMPTIVSVFVGVNFQVDDLVLHASYLHN